MKITSPAYRLDEIASAIGGKIVGNNSSEISEISIDSRAQSDYFNTLFFCIKGERQDGHHFAEDLILKGVRSFVVEENYIITNKNCNYIIVPNALSALQNFASFHRKKFTIPCLGVTGSNGKTVVKEWLFQLMQPDVNIVRSPKSYNSQVGVPLSVLQMDESHEYAIFEAGISKVGEMERLEKIIQPTLGLFTNVGEAHSANFSTHYQKALEKTQLFSHCEVVFCSSDHKEVVDALMASGIKKLVMWSTKAKGDLQIEDIQKSAKHTVISAVYNNHSLQLNIPFTDDASIENALHCWLFLLYKGYSQSIIQDRFLGLTNIEMRLEMKEGINDCLIINDTYNSDLPSLKIALDFLDAQSQHEKKVVIVSDIEQSRTQPELLYKQMGELLKHVKPTEFIGIGKELVKFQSFIPVTEKRFYQTTEEFIKALSPNSFHDKTVLLKGARNFGFEKISHLLEKKTHETQLEVNLSSLLHNLHYFKSLVKPQTKLMVMIKAFGYGSGGYEIARTLEFNRVDYLAVAYVDEGVELRKSGIKVPIVVMSPEATSFDIMDEYQLEPEIFSINRLKQLIAYLQKKDKNDAFPIHLKLDTGMKRLGFEEEELDELCRLLSDNPTLHIASVFSHLVGSENTSLDTFTQEQFKKFTESCDFIKEKTKSSFLRHILNSGGIERFPEHQYEMVRLGIGLHGVGTKNKQLLPVSTLKSVVAQVKNVKKGQSIGYSRGVIVEKDTKIAIVSIGYADGFNRKFSNGVGSVWIKGKIYSIIGSICMDMCMIDVSGHQVLEGDEVEIFGNHISIHEMATKIGTIPYEILTSISRRVKRVYIQE